MSQISAGCKTFTKISTGPPLFGRDTGLDCVITIQRLVETESFTNKNKKELEIGYKCSLKFFLFNEDVE